MSKPARPRRLRGGRRNTVGPTERKPADPRPESQAPTFFQLVIKKLVERVGRTAGRSLAELTGVVQGVGGRKKTPNNTNGVLAVPVLDRPGTKKKMRVELTIGTEKGTP